MNVPENQRSKLTTHALNILKKHSAADTTSVAIYRHFPTSNDYLVNGYVGQTPVSRIFSRKSEYRKGNSHFETNYKIAPDCFKTDILKVCKPEEADYYESFYMRLYDTVRKGYNSKYGRYKFSEQELSENKDRYPSGDWDSIPSSKRDISNKFEINPDKAIAMISVETNTILDPYRDKDNKEFVFLNLDALAKHFHLSKITDDVFASFDRNHPFKKQGVYFQYAEDYMHNVKWILVDYDTYQEKKNNHRKLANDDMARAFFDSDSLAQYLMTCDKTLKVRKTVTNKISAARKAIRDAAKEGKIIAPVHVYDYELLTIDQYIRADFSLGTDPFDSYSSKPTLIEKKPIVSEKENIQKVSGERELRHLKEGAL